jgi:hypothetical protein
MEMVGGLDLHRSQITFRTLDLRPGEVQRGKIHPGAREAVRDWPERFEAGTDAHFALEGTTGLALRSGGDRAPGLRGPLQETLPQLKRPFGSAWRSRRAFPSSPPGLQPASRRSSSLGTTLRRRRRTWPGRWRRAQSSPSTMRAW